MKNYPGLNWRNYTQSVCFADDEDEVYPPNKSLFLPFKLQYVSFIGMQ